MKIFLDDCPYRTAAAKERGFTTVASVEEFIELMKKSENIEKISLDHDLGQGYPTGTDAAQYLVDWSSNLNYIPVIIHSQNPVGAVRMETMLRNAGYTVYRKPYKA